MVAGAEVGEADADVVGAEVVLAGADVVGAAEVGADVLGVEDVGEVVVHPTKTKVITSEITRIVKNCLFIYFPSLILNKGILISKMELPALS